MFRAYGPPVSSQSSKEGPDARQPERIAAMRSWRGNADPIFLN
jgi:hypothetical protein